MKTSKIRHQLFLPEQLSRQSTAIARSSGRSHSEILVEALEAFLSRRAAPPSDEAMAARLTHMERNIERIRRNQAAFWVAMSRLIRHQLITAAGLPVPSAAAQANGVANYQKFIDELARLLSQHDQSTGYSLIVDAARTIQ